MSGDLTAPPDWRRLVSGAKDEPGYASGLIGSLVEPIALDDADDYDVVIVGEPYDRGHILGRPGARHGPRALREGLANTKTTHIDYGEIDLAVGDLGDVRLPGGTDNETAHRAIESAIRDVHAREATPVILGGDHSIAHPNVVPLLETYDSVGVVNFDSHDDLRDPIDGQPHTASPFKQLYEDGLDAYAIVGARPFGLGNVDYLRERGGATISSERVGAEPAAAGERALEAMEGVDAIYVTLDIDVLDMGFVPGTSSPYPGGILPRELFRLVREIARDDRVVGMEVVECSPLLDEGDRTSANGGRAIAHFLTGVQLRE